MEFWQGNFRNLSNPGSGNSPAPFRCHVIGVSHCDPLELLPFTFAVPKAPCWVMRIRLHG